jgi:hypothetical protein
MKIFITRESGEKLELDDDLGATAQDGTKLWLDAVARVFGDEVEIVSDAANFLQLDGSVGIEGVVVTIED